MFVYDKAPDIAVVLRAEIIKIPVVYIVLPCHEQFIYTKPIELVGQITKSLVINLHSH